MQGPRDSAGQSDPFEAPQLSAWDILAQLGYDKLLIAQFKQVYPNLSEERAFLEDLEAFVALQAATTGNVGLPGLVEFSERWLKGDRGVR